jgi:hypothetical protein
LTNGKLPDIINPLGFLINSGKNNKDHIYKTKIYKEKYIYRNQQRLLLKASAIKLARNGPQNLV